MLKAIIVEDEKRSRDTLQGLLKLYCKNVEVVAEAEGVESGKMAIEKFNPDIVFLDIQMPDGSGFKLLEELKDISFEIIFTTAYDQFAIKAIKFSALDYLLKPIFPDDLVSAVKKVEEKRKVVSSETNVEVLLENIRKPENEPPKIVLSTYDQLHVVYVDEIIRCESDNYYTFFYFKDGSRMLISKTLKENEELLKTHGFIRPHKSHLVNIAYIEGFNKKDGGHIILKDGNKIPVSRRKREMILETLGNIQ
jgi:two-component system LytT family response regulator